jgi:hypothetical protein
VVDKKDHRFNGGQFPIPPLKTFGSRCAQPIEKRRIRAAILIFCLYW